MALPVPLELTFRDVAHEAALDSLVRQQVHRLQRFCDHIDSCRVAIERPHRHQGSGDDFRVRIDLRVAAGREIVADQHSTEAPLQQVVRDAFHAAERQLKKVQEQQRGFVKAHPESDVQGIVAKLMPDYGFIASQGRDVYFHANSVVSGEFDDLRVGMGVAFREEPGNDGPQASSVRVVDARGLTRD